MRKRKIQVLHISISDGGGGAAIAAFRLHQLFNKNSSVINSKMLVLVKKTIDDSIHKLNFFQRQIARIGNILNNFLGRFYSRNDLFSFDLFGANINNHKLIKKADVLYIHWINNGMLDLRKIEKIFSLNKPVILFSHDMWYFSGGCHVSRECTNYLKDCKECPYFKSILLKSLIHKNFRTKKRMYQKMNLRLVLPSSNYYEKALRSEIIEVNKMKFIPNVLDIEFFTPPTNNFHNKIRVLFGAFGGKENPYKGWDDFVYFVNEINQKFIDQIEIFLFGYEFSQQELLDLPFIAKSYGVVSQQEIVEIYHNADVFIFPSVQESFGQTLVEAMSCGVVPIAYNAGIASDVIENKKNGFIVNVGEKEKLVESFEALLKIGLASMKIEARKTIEKEFSHEKLFKQHLTLIEELL